MKLWTKVINTTMNISHHKRKVTIHVSWWSRQYTLRCMRCILAKIWSQIKPSDLTTQFTGSSGKDEHIKGYHRDAISDFPTRVGRQRTQFHQQIKLQGKKMTQVGVWVRRGLRIVWMLFWCQFQKHTFQLLWDSWIPTRWLLTLNFIFLVLGEIMILSYFSECFTGTHWNIYGWDKFMSCLCFRIILEMEKMWACVLLYVDKTRLIMSW